MIIHEETYCRWIKEQGVGDNDRVGNSRESYVRSLNKVSELLNIDVSPQTLSSRGDVIAIARKLKEISVSRKPAHHTIDNYKSAMQQYVAMVKAGRVSTALELTRDLPVLFCYVGWTEFYDGTEPVLGNFSWIKNNPTDNGESAAFVRSADGKFRCGIGRGEIHETPFHVVFVARDQVDGDRKVVGMYAAAVLEDPDADWLFSTTSSAVMYPSSRRSVVPVDAWPGHMGVRRWASRQDGSQHEALRSIFDALRSELLRSEVHTSSRVVQSSTLPLAENAPQDELNALEGQTQLRLSRHRSRESKLRQAKILAVLHATGGRLVCEVPECGFDFHRRYGELGRGYAQVHHMRPLASLDADGERVSLGELAIVCANCHAMIHRGGESRPLADIVLHVSQDDQP